MKLSNFLNDLADIVDLNSTHALSFQLRRLSQEERTKLSNSLRHIAEDQQKIE